jgi:hypothetical protein
MIKVFSILQKKSVISIMSAYAMMIGKRHESKYARLAQRANGTRSNHIKLCKLRISSFIHEQAFLGAMTMMVYIAQVVGMQAPGKAVCVGVGRARKIAEPIFRFQVRHLGKFHTKSKRHWMGNQLGCASFSANSNAISFRC